jgi:putative membrane protein insertion efficiency factor
MKKIMIFFIRMYQKGISPLFPACCRFEPTCSAYALQALERFGFFRGMYLTIRRLIRCTPFFQGGYDPVPATWDDVKRRKKH